MRKLLTACLILCVSAMPVMAESNVDIVPRGNWAKVESVCRIYDMVVTLDTGDIIEGSCRGLDKEAIHLKLDKQTRYYSKQSVVEIHIIDPNKSRNKGTLIGLGIGTGAAIAIVAAKSNSDDPYKNLSWATVPIFASVGALIGYLADKDNKKLIYRY